MWHKLRTEKPNINKEPRSRTEIMTVMELLQTSFSAIISSNSLVLQLSDASLGLDGSHERSLVLY